MAQIEIFDVEHGACSLLTADNGTRLMIDCGHNATTGWTPGRCLRRRNITTLEMLAVTNYDEDHVSGIADLLDNVNVQRLLRNESVSAEVLRNLKSEDGMGPGIDRLVHAITDVFTVPGGTGPMFEGIERRVFRNPYPTFEDENNLSMALFLKCHGIGVMFPGDLEKEGLLALLQDKAFQQALQETNVYVAPHHGRESGCCEELIPHLRNVYYVVISDKGYQYDTQETVPFYSRIAKGGPFRSQGTRKVLTTRNDGAITFELGRDSWGPR